jgi:hypothetical protein
MTLQAFITLAILVEVATGIVKTVISQFNLTLYDWVDQAISLAFSTLIAVAGRVDFFSIVNQIIPVDFNLPKALGIMLSALVLSRGSNAIHDLFKRLNPPAENQMRLW